MVNDVGALHASLRLDKKEKKDRFSGIFKIFQFTIYHIFLNMENLKKNLEIERPYI